MRFDDLVDGYVYSKRFDKLSVSTKEQRLISLTHLKVHLSGYRIHEITRPMVIAIRDHHYDSPGRCKMMMAVLKSVMNYAFDNGWLEKLDAFAAISDMPKSTPIPRWSEPEITSFLSTAPAHLRDVMMVALYTGQRRSDLCKMDWNDYDGEIIRVVQQKTGKHVAIPVHPILKMHLATMKRRRWGDRTPILLNAYRAAWQPDSMRVAVKTHCRRIGLGEKQLHGVRKTTASILAEIGCTPHQIAAITGHQSLKEVQRYTIEAEQKRMATEAIGKWRVQ